MQSLRRVVSLLTMVAFTGLPTPIRSLPSPASTPLVNLVRIPNGGIQPQTVLDADGVLHMVYFVGSASGGDIEYVQRASEHAVFSRPIRVNSRPSTAIAIGTVRGPQLAVGRKGNVFVIWFGPG